MGKREQLEDEAQKDLDRVFPGTRRAKLPVHGYTSDNRGPLIPAGDPKQRTGRR